MPAISQYISSNTNFNQKRIVEMHFRRRTGGIPKAASISSITYNGVGLYPWRANTRDRDERVFSPPLRLAIFFQLFLGGRTLKTMPCKMEA